mmetsp:Transcript_44395/g.114883  ORF Transcript_44395/g.114883 Transcript_44395/m.114883 type:complete len:255 (-) Transcript_44395:434-1198(-)
MQHHGHCQRDAEPLVGEGGNERRHALRDVVQSDARDEDDDTLLAHARRCGDSGVVVAAQLGRGHAAHAHAALLHAGAAPLLRPLLGGRLLCYCLVERSGVRAVGCHQLVRGQLQQHANAGAAKEAGSDDPEAGGGVGGLGRQDRSLCREPCQATLHHHARRERVEEGDEARIGVADDAHQGRAQHCRGAGHGGKPPSERDVAKLTAVIQCPGIRARCLAIAFIHGCTSMADTEGSEQRGRGVTKSIPGSCETPY